MYSHLNMDDNGVSTMSSNHQQQQPISSSYQGIDSPTQLQDETLVPPSTTSVATTYYWKSKDFKEFIVCLLFGIICFVLAEVTDVYTTQRPIPFQFLEDSGEFIRNLSINEPFDNETVPDSLLVVLAMILPLCIQLLISQFYGEMGDKHSTVCIYMVALSLTQLVTDVIKMYCGYLRPIFYTICQPNETYDTCTNTNTDSESYRRSFPSGHASTSFCGLTLLSLFLHTKYGIPCMKRKLAMGYSSNITLSSQQHQLYQINNNSNTASSSKVRDPLIYRGISVLSLLPMGVACFIAASRVVDNKHFPADITAGSIIGTTIAYYIHYLWYF